MYKYDLQPTPGNIEKSIENDITGRNSYLSRFVTLLNHQVGPWSIAIDASWGSGKTFFVKECQLILDICSKEDPLSRNSTLINKLYDEKNISEVTKIPYSTVYFDAWENDGGVDPILSIINSISLTPWKNTASKSIEALLDIASSISKATLHINPKEYIDSIKNNLRSDNSEESLRNKFNAALSKLIPKDGRLIIFIDELDRCKPTYAVKLLERIKHYFINDKVTFAFSVDLNELQNTIKRFYGENFNGLQYLDRFFDLVISLPEPDIESYFRKTDGILEINDIFRSDNNYCADFCKTIIKYFNFSLREVNHFYLRLNSATYNLFNDILNKNSLFPKKIMVIFY